jgi:N-acetylglutamate synthase
MPFQLRAMSNDDYPAVMALWQQSEGLTLREADSAAAIAAYLLRNPGLSFVALTGTQLVGAVLVGTDGRRGYLQHLTVSESSRGQGIGKALLAAATAALHGIGIDKTHLMVLAENEAAMTFYRHLGWAERANIRLFSFNAGGRDNC